MKFGRNVLQLIMHRLTESDFQSDIIFKIAAMMSFHTKSTAIWRLHTQYLFKNLENDK